mgnify:CR=1 FL=1
MLDIISVDNEQVVLARRMNLERRVGQTFQVDYGYRMAQAKRSLERKCLRPDTVKVIAVAQDEIVHP